MGLFVTSTTSATRHGVFAIKRTPQTTLRSQGTSVAALVGQFPWGPLQLATEPASIGDAITQFAPLGMTRTGSAYLSLIAKPWAGLRIVRVLGATAAKATTVLTTTGPVTKVTLTAKYQGTEGNSLVAVVTAASDADANHFDLNVTVSNASGSTTDTIKNINFSGTGSDSTFTQAQLDALQLIGVPVKTATGRPDNGTYTFTGGTNGTIASTDYVGTAGVPDKGLSLLEADKKVRHVVVDDTGSSLRDAVNAGLIAHQALMGDRCVYLNGDSGQTAAAARTDVASYRQSGVAYVDPWVYIYDDTTGAEQLVPPAPFMAAVAAQLSPSTSPAWKNAEVQSMLSAIVRLEAARGEGAATNTAAGISTLIREENGGHTFEAAPNTIAPSDPALEDLTTTRMDQYIASAFVASTRGSVDAPNVEQNRDDLVIALDGFMAELKANKGIDPNHRPHVVDYVIPGLDTQNTANGFAAGDVNIPLNAQYSNGMKRIFLVMKTGTNPLTVTAQ